jgi:uncharacterized protein (DUF1778 family)
MSKARSSSSESLDTAAVAAAEGSSVVNPKGSDNQRPYVLASDRHEAFVSALDNPPAPGPKLRSLLRRVPVWQKFPGYFHRMS